MGGHQVVQAARVDPHRELGQLPADVARRHRAVGEQREHRGASVRDPGVGVGDPGRGEPRAELAVLVAMHVHGGRRVRHPDRLVATDPQRAAHRVVADQRPVVVERLLDGGEQRVLHAREDGQVDGDGVRRVQRHEVVGDRDDVVGAAGREEPVPERQPGAALVVVDAADRHPASVPHKPRARPPMEDRARGREAVASALVVALRGHDLVDVVLDDRRRGPVELQHVRVRPPGQLGPAGGPRVHVPRQLAAQPGPVVRRA